MIGQLIVSVVRKAPIAFGVIGAVTVAAVVWTTAWEMDARTETCTIRYGQQVGTSFSKFGQETSSQKRIATTACGTLNVDDDMVRLRFGSEADFASIVPGGTYRLTVVGWQGAIFSTLPNVVAVHPGA